MPKNSKNKPSIEVVNLSNTSSFVLRTFEEYAFSAPYHFHPEYELTLILKGHGKRYVGSHLGSYDEGDIVLIGPNLPHCWKTEEPISGEINAHSIVIHFTEDFLGQAFFTKPELLSIRELLKRSAHGLQFSGNGQQEIYQSMVSLSKETNAFKKLIQLLDILHTLSLCQSCKPLNAETNTPAANAIDLHRIHPVMNYLIENYKHTISLQEAASIANMAPNSFCRYFKKITRKTFMETVLDYRLDYAMQQLAHTDKSVSEICFGSGFTDISHFYKLFKAKMKLSPRHYRKTFHQQL